MGNYIPIRFDKTLQACCAEEANIMPVEWLDDLTIEDVYHTESGFLRVASKHNARFNIVLPEQLLDMFTAITTIQHGPRSKSEVIEHLIIAYCQENGVKLEFFRGEK